MFFSADLYTLVYAEISSRSHRGTPDRAVGVVLYFTRWCKPGVPTGLALVGAGDGLQRGHVSQIQDFYV